MNQITISFSS